MDSDNEMNDFRVNRRTYLIIYSKADLSKFPSRENFREAVVEGFNYGPGKVKVEYWACCLEQHENTNGHTIMFRSNSLVQSDETRLKHTWLKGI